MFDYNSLYKQRAVNTYMSTHIATVALGEPNPEAEETLLRSEITHVQEEVLHENGEQAFPRVEVYSLVGGFAKIPTIQEKYLLDQALCEWPGSAEDIMISPNMGVANTHYSKDPSTMRIPMSSGGLSTHNGEDWWRTDEDAMRFWMLQSDEFRQELAQQGWIHFEHVKDVPDHEAKEIEKLFNNSFTSGKPYKRQMPLSNLIAICEHEKDRPSQKTEDLRELQEALGEKDAEKLTYMYNKSSLSFSSSSFLFVKPSGRSEGLALKVSTSGLTGKDTEPLLRSAAFDVSFRTSYGASEARWVNPDSKSRVLGLINNYIKAWKLNASVHLYENGLGASISVDDHSSCGTKPEKANTRLLLSRTRALRGFANRAIDLEAEDYETKTDAKYLERKSSLGLNA